jgi:hypothetical protein
MPQAKSQNTTNVAIDVLLPLPKSDTAWEYCAEICRTAFIVLQDDAPTGFPLEIDTLLEAGKAMTAMAVLCRRAHARLAASRIKAAKTGIRSQPFRAN